MGWIWAGLATAACKRGARLLGRLVRSAGSGVRVRALGGDRAGEMRITRFVRNARVTPAEMFATAAARTGTLVRGRHILAIQDTTTLRDDGRDCSLLMHPTIAVDAADGALLGLVHGQMLRRQGGLKARRKTACFADKQSHRWLKATQAAGMLAEHGASGVTVVADREGDIYEEFACRPAGVDLLIRAAQDRCLAGQQRLFTCAQAWPELGRITVTLAAGPGRPARTATLAVRAGAISLARPQRPAAERAALPATVDLHLVEACEIAAPVGQPCVHWRLLTTHGVTTLIQARQIIGFYRQRWTIEQLFRICKTKGFDIEAVRIEAPDPFDNLAAATLIAAIRVLQLVRDRDGTAARPVQDVFEPDDLPPLQAACAELEGKTERQKNPHPIGSLAYAAWVCARLGGWTGYYGKPGPIVMLNGYRQFQAIQQGWRWAKHV